MLVEQCALSPKGFICVVPASLHTLIFFHPNLNIKMVFGEKKKTLKLATFSNFEAVFCVECLILLPTYPNFGGHQTGTTHIFQLGLMYVVVFVV